MTSQILNLEEGVEESFRFPEFEELSVAPGPDLSARPDAQLADFQQEGLVAIHEHFEKRHEGIGLVSLPAGSGKTRVTAEWVIRHQIARGRRVLWLTHRLDLLNQLHRDLRSLAWLLGGLRRRLSISRVDGHSASLKGAIVLATAGAIARSAFTAKDLNRGGFRLGAVVIDEPDPSFLGQVTEVLERAQTEKKAPVLGVTSTPLLPDIEEAQRLPGFFGGHVVFERSFRDLLHSGFLARPVFVRRALSTTESLDFPADEIEASLGAPDLTEPLLALLGGMAARDEEIVDHWIRGAGRFGKTLVFACDATHAEALADRLASRGVAAAATHSRLEEETRLERLSAFRQGSLRVLVHAGSLAEGEIVPDTQTVVLARPTTNLSRFLRMIGCGARGPRLVPGKDRFNVLECVDGFGRYGLQLAGPRAARWLESDITRQMPVARAPREEEARLRHAAIASALAWVRARGLSSAETSFWGELAWVRPDGAARAVAVFAGSLGAVQEGVGLAVTALASDQWHAVERHAATLEELGAMRAVDWNDMLFDVRRTRRLPELRRVAELRPDAEDEQAADALLWLGRAAVELGIDAALSICEQVWREQPLLCDRFESAAALKSEVLRLYPHLETRARGRQGGVPGVSWEDVGSFACLAAAVATADGELAEAERGTIRLATRRIFQLEREADLKRAEALIVAAETSPGDVERAARRLRCDAPWATVLCVFDWLLHVGIADGKFVEAERVLLGGIAALLGISQEEYRRRCSWYLNIDPAVPLQVAPGTRTCVACGASFSEEARFCGACGASLGRDGEKPLSAQ